MATLATQIQAVAVGWQIYAIARNPLALGYVGLAQFIPMATLFFVAGDVVDHHNRRRILTITYAAQALATVLLLMLTCLSVQDERLFYIALVLLGSARAFGQPAGQSFLPQLVSSERFPQAVAWTSSSRQSAVIIGPALGGFIYIWGPAVAYAVCLFFYVATGLAIATLHTNSQPRPLDPSASAFRRVTAGIRFIRSQPTILGAISLDLFAVLLGGATALLPIYARDISRLDLAGSVCSRALRLQGRQ
jgi:MFS family permease